LHRSLWGQGRQANSAVRITGGGEGRKEKMKKRKQMNKNN
jgi:hypothetical protein